jgi:hypothetical protein
MTADCGMWMIMRLGGGLMQQRGPVAALLH